MDEEFFGLELFRGGRLLSEQISNAREGLTALLASPYVDRSSRAYVELFNLKMIFSAWEVRSMRMEQVVQDVTQRDAERRSRWARLFRYRPHP